MSKHLRFGRLLGLLAVMLTLSFAWAQGQNLSSEKVLGAVKITAADNSAVLFDDVTGTVNETTKEVSIQFPYRYNVGEPDNLTGVPLKASFKSSKFSNLFKGQASATDLMIGSGWRTTNALGQGFGNESNAPWILSANAFVFANNDVVTLEAENHSYIYYTVKVSIAPASTAKDIVSMEASWSKDWSTPCAALTDEGDAVVTISGSTIKVAVPYGTDLANIPLNFYTSPFAVAYLGTAPTTPIAAGPNPDNWVLNANLTSPITIWVYSQAYHIGDAHNASLGKSYTVSAEVGIPSELDVMKQLVFKASDNPSLGGTDVVATLDPATQKWTAVVPFGVVIGDLKPSWETSLYANMFNSNPLAGGAVEICSASVLASLSGDHHHGWWDDDEGDHHDWHHNWYCWWKEHFFGWVNCQPPTPPTPVYVTLIQQFGEDFDGCGSFWVQAEDDSEVSEYPFCVTNAPCATANNLLTIDASWSKANVCGQGGNYPAYTGNLTDVVPVGTTVTFNVPYGVTSVSTSGREVSQFAKSAPGTVVKYNGDTINVWSQCGQMKQYTVAIVQAPIGAGKEILTYGFKAADNTGLGFDWNNVDYAGVIDPATRRITVTVPWVTDLHHLISYFTTSPYSCVFIANTNGNLPQVSRSTDPLLNNNDHSNTLTYIVKAEDGTEERYQVMVVKTPISSVKTITDMSLLNLPYCQGITSVTGSTYTATGAGIVTISGTNINISVKNGTSLTAMPYSITLGTHLCTVAISNGTAVKTPFSSTVTGTANFSSPVTMTVTAQDYSQTVYTITVTPRAANSQKVLTSYWFKKTLNTIGNADAVGDIDQATRIVTVHVPFGTDPNGLKASFVLNNGTTDYPGGAVMTHSEDQQYLQTTDVTANDFRHQVAYTIWAEDCSTLEYFVNVIVDPNAGNDILSLSLSGLEYPNCESCETPGTVGVSATITGSNIAVTVPFGTNLSDIHIIGAASPGATISPALSTILTYTSPITLTVTAANGISTKTYTLTVTKAAALTGSQMLTFGFEKSKNPTFDVDRWTAVPINQTTFRIDVKVPFGTDLTALKASFTHSPMSCVYVNGQQWTAADLQCTGVSVNDFSDALTYTVKAQSGAETYYNVYVTMDAPLTEKVLSAFNVTNVAYCQGLNISPATYSIAGTGTTAIAISVKAGTSLTNLSYSFTVSATATVTATNGTPVKNGTSVTGTANFTTPVTFTVKAQDNSTQTYVVTVTPRAVNSAKQLTKYNLKNPGGVADLEGVINETAKTVDVWVPWGTSVTALVGVFEINNATNAFAGGAILTHSELADGVVDKQVIQTTGVTANDFTTPVAFTVIAEDCSTVEYFVTVRMIPNTDTGISGFNFVTNGCGCNLSTRIDAYARRIYVSVPATMDISNLAPSSIVVTPAIGTRPAATVSPAAGVAQNWTNGPVKYTVTAPDGVTKADWMVYVTNPKCKDTNILSFSLPNAQVSPSDFVAGFGQPVTIDTVNHKIDVIIKAGVNLSSVYYERTLPCNATICCVGGNCQDNHYLDFSQGGCHTCVVTAEDQTVTQQWTICVHEIDTKAPEVTTWSVMAYNCSDSVAVQSNELGRVFIVNQNAIYMNQDPNMCKPLYNLADWTGTGSTSVKALIDAKLGNWATVTAVDTPVYVKTNGLYSGVYWAFSVDAWGHVSCISKEKLFLDMCDVTVATLCDLRGMSDVWRYTLTQEVFVSHEEAKTSGNWKFVQTADCGILVEDKLNVLPATYGVGTGLTGLKGLIDKTTNTVKLIPVCCYTPTKSSTGNVIPVKELTWDQYNTQCYTGKGFESMLVKVTTPMKATNDYNQGPNWMFDGLDLKTVNAYGAATWFIQSIFNTPLIGTVIPTVPAYYSGVRTNVTWSGTVYGLFTPRKASDITYVTTPVISAVSNPTNINGVLPGQCKSATIKIYNEGITDLNITALYLDNAAADDEFQIVPSASVTVPFVIAPWTYKSVEVKFCPLDAGSETTNMVVEYGVGKTMVVPINGTTPLIFDMPYTQEFTYTAGPPALWETGDTFNNYTNYTGWTHTTAATAVGGVYVGYYSNWVTPYGGFNGSRSIYMRPRGGSATAAYIYPVTVTTPGFRITGADPVVSWVETAWWALNGNAFHNVGSASDPRTLSISEDGVNWSTLRSVRADQMSYETETVASYTNPTWDKVIVSLKDYVGKTVYFKFDLGLTTGKYVYWIIDNFEVKQRVTQPIIQVTGSGDFGGVQVGATGTQAFSVKNVGISVLKVKKVALTGDAAFTLTDANTYPFEVTDGPGTWAYTVGANGSALNFSVDFKPTDIGVKTGKVTITYGLYSDMTVEIPLTGEGLSCYTAAVANKGENWAPSQNTWFKYTADKFSIVEVNSCHPHQQRVGTEYSWDTFLYLYSDCTGTLIGSHDDMEAACVYNRTASSVQTVMNAGETIYIFWPLSFPTALHAYEGFYFNINVSYPLDGDVCENAIPLTLPVVNHFGTTVGFADDYNISPCSPFSNYMDGNDKVYSITLPYDGYLTASILGAYGSIHVLDLCPKEELEKFHCKAFTGGPNGGTINAKKIVAGTYFVIISTWAPPQTVDYLLNMSFQGLGVDENALNSTLSVYPNPNSGKFTVSVNNPEATDMTIELVNISGQVVYRNEVKAAYSYNEDIDASTFAKGVYYLKVNDAKGVKVEKVVVQ